MLCTASSSLNYQLEYLPKYIHMKNTADKRFFSHNVCKHSLGFYSLKLL